MRGRLDHGLTDRATIRKRVEDGDGDGDGDGDDGLYDEPSGTGSSDEYDPGDSYEDVVEDVATQFDDESTEYVRTDSGEVVQSPATATFGGEVDDSIEEDYVVEVDGVDARFEVEGLDTTRDHHRGTVVSVKAALRRASK